MYSDFGSHVLALQVEFPLHQSLTNLNASLESLQAPWQPKTRATAVASAVPKRAMVGIVVYKPPLKSSDGSSGAKWRRNPHPKHPTITTCKGNAAPILAYLKFYQNDTPAMR